MGRAEPRTSSRKMKTKKKSYARRGCGGGCSRKTKQKKNTSKGKGKSINKDEKQNIITKQLRANKDHKTAGQTSQARPRSN